LGHTCALRHKPNTLLFEAQLLATRHAARLRGCPELNAEHLQGSVITIMSASITRLLAQHTGAAQRGGRMTLIAHQRKVSPVEEHTIALSEDEECVHCDATRTEATALNVHTASDECAARNRNKCSPDSPLCRVMCAKIGTRTVAAVVGIVGGAFVGGREQGRVHQQLALRHLHHRYQST